jgi:leucyl aminopeptidase
MKVEVSPAEPGELDVDVLGVPVSQPADAARLPASLRGRLAPLVESGEADGALGTAPLLHLNSEVPLTRVVAAGVGEHVDADAIRTAAAAVARAVAGFGRSIGWLIDESLGLSPAEQARAAVEGIAYGAYTPGRWKSDGPSTQIERVVLSGAAGDEVTAAAERAAQVVTWIAVARDLANAPPNELFPEALANRARELAERLPHLEVDALGRAEIERLGMGAFAAVAQGSDREPRLIVMRYEPPGAGGQLTLGLVGKAITFDTGGISLKPALAMESMKGDMAGGAAVIAGIAAVAALELPVRVLAVVAASENMPGGNAFCPGDIVRAMNGRTIEIINTDAEGRLVLADALWYAREQGATHVVDFATLTGAMVLALGDLYAGVFANDEEWRERLLDAAVASGDHLWPFPLHPRYRRYVDSTFADLKNASALKEGSPVLAAEFLREFVGEGPWAHVDMAGPGYLERSRGDFLTERGGTGYGVRLIVELAERLSA